MFLRLYFVVYFERSIFRLRSACLVRTVKKAHIGTCQKRFSQLRRSPFCNAAGKALPHPPAEMVSKGLPVLQKVKAVHALFQSGDKGVYRPQVLQLFGQSAYIRGSMGIITEDQPFAGIGIALRHFLGTALFLFTGHTVHFRSTVKKILCTDKQHPNLLDYVMYCSFFCRALLCPQG